MSYGYFEGQEAEALAFFRKLLEAEPDSNRRNMIEELVGKLEKIVEQKKPSVEKQELIQNACPA